MKKIFFTLTAIFNLFNAALYANPYYATLEPVETYNIKASVSGKVVFIDRSLEGKEIKKVNRVTLIQIDDSLNKIDLQMTDTKIDIVKSMIKIEESNYETINKLATKSKIEKDSAKLKVLNLESTLSDLKTKKATLEDTINNKRITVNNAYVYKLMVNTGDYVGPGTPLAVIKDISKGKLTFYIPIDQAGTIRSKEIYLNGQKSQVQINKIYQIADEVKISSYRCEIIVPDPTVFSQLVKIEFIDSAEK
jgi:hypothetical protein